MDKKMTQRKEIAQGIAGKEETAPRGVPVKHKACGGKVKKVAKKK